jgi:hypothetical protein
MFIDERNGSDELSENGNIIPIFLQILRDFISL